MHFISQPPKSSFTLSLAHTGAQAGSIPSWNTFDPFPTLGNPSGPPHNTVSITAAVTATSLYDDISHLHQTLKRYIQPSFITLFLSIPPPPPEITFQGP